MLYAEVPEQRQWKRVATLVLHIIVRVYEYVVKFVLLLSVLLHRVQKVAVVLFVGGFVVGDEIRCFALQNGVPELMVGRRLFLLHFCTANDARVGLLLDEKGKGGILGS